MPEQAQWGGQSWLALAFSRRLDTLESVGMRRHWWGGPTGLRGTPPSRCRHNGVSILQGANRPTGASAADGGVRPTIYPGARQTGKVRGMRKDCLPPSVFQANLSPLNFCGYATLDIVVSSFGTLRAVVGVLYFFAQRV
jgi:hypothetical protein